MLIAAGAAALLPRGDRIPAGWAWIAAGAAALAQFATIWDDTDPRGGDYAPWYIRGATIICAAVILRRRAGTAWAGALLGYAGASAIGLLTGDSLGQWSALVLRQTGTLIAIQVEGILLTRGRRAVATLREEERTRLAAVQRREAIMRQRGEAERIRSLVAPTLQRIAAGETSAELSREAMLLEGELRDALRGHRLAAGSVPAVVSAARARGVDILLLDDLGDSEEHSIPEHLPDAALSWVASRLSTAGPPRATVRLAAGADGRPTISFYAESSGEAPEYLAVDLPDPAE